LNQRAMQSIAEQVTTISTEIKKTEINFNILEQAVRYLETASKTDSLSGELYGLVPGELEDLDILESLAEIFDGYDEDEAECYFNLTDFDKLMRPIWEQLTPTATAVSSPSVEEPAIPEEDDESYEEAVIAASIERTT